MNHCRDFLSPCDATVCKFVAGSREPFGTRDAFPTKVAVGIRFAHSARNDRPMSPYLTASLETLPAMDAASLGIVRLQYSAVYLIDSDESAYTTAVTGVDLTQVRLHYFATAAEVLRVPAYESPLLYFVNAELADMSGFDLYGILQERWPRVAGYVISDTYSAMDEIRARCAGSTLYFCKPLSEGWLASMLEGLLPDEALTPASLPNAQSALLWKRPAARRAPHQQRHP